jgi:hypothetical protein
VEVTPHNSSLSIRSDIGGLHHVLAALPPGELVLVPTGQDALEINPLTLPDCHGKSSIQEVEDSFHRQTGLNFKKETSTMLYLQHSAAW